VRSALTIIPLDISVTLPTHRVCLHAQASVRATPTNSLNISLISLPGKWRTNGNEVPKTRQQSLSANSAAKKGDEPGPSLCPPNGDQKSLGLRRESAGLAGMPMTVNIGLVTNEALVLGCDSIASVISHYINPFQMELQKTRGGKPKLDKDGKLTLKFSLSDVEEIVTDAWGGVTKMFEIHRMPTPVVAVTAGLAKLRDRPISGFAEEFCETCKDREPALVTVKQVADEFLSFMKGHYDGHYAKSPLPAQFREGPEFLVGGFGKDDNFPSLFRVIVKESKIRPEFVNGKSGVSWNGQADAVERFIRGYDGPLRHDIEERVLEELQKYHSTMTARSAEIINHVLKELKAKMPNGVDINLSAPSKIALPWSNYRTSIAYGNLPLQEAVNSVSFLVNLQSGKARFARGVATVGGRVHIGYVTKSKGFQLLNEPELVHRYTGFGDGF